MSRLVSAPTAARWNRAAELAERLARRPQDEADVQQRPADVGVIVVELDETLEPGGVAAARMVEARYTTYGGVEVLAGSEIPGGVADRCELLTGPVEGRALAIPFARGWQVIAASGGSTIAPGVLLDALTPGASVRVRLPDTSVVIATDVVESMGAPAGTRVIVGSTPWGWVILQLACVTQGGH